MLPSLRRFRRYRTPRLAVILALTVGVFCGCGDVATVQDSVPTTGPSAASEAQCDVILRLDSAVELSTLDFTLDYSRAPGMFIGGGAEVECVALVENIAVSLNNTCDGQSGACTSGPDRKIYLGILGNRTFLGPNDVIRCRFVGTRPLEVEDLDIEVLNAASDGDNGRRPADMVVGAIDCSGVSRTTTSTTSTTLSTCAGECRSGFACFGGECLAVDSYKMDFRLDAPVAIGALQITVAYDPAQASILGNGDDTQCWPYSGINTFTSFNNDTNSGEYCSTIDPRTSACFQAAIVGPTGITGPVKLFSCNVAGTASTPQASQFSIVVVDASAPGGRPISPHPAVSISDLRPAWP